jgi:hypothetical protein
MNIKVINIVIILLFIAKVSYSQNEVQIKGLNPTDKVIIKQLDGTLIHNPLIGHKYSYTNSDITNIKKVRIRKELTTGEYIERVYELKAGVDNVVYMVTLGFFETDRKELDSLVVRATRRIERKQGSLNEIKSWLIMAIKNLQTAH